MWALLGMVTHEALWGTFAYLYGRDPIVYMMFGLIPYLLSVGFLDSLLWRSRNDSRNAKE